MSIKINSFGGPFVWVLRKYFSGVTSRIMLQFVSKYYARNTDEFIRYFFSQKEPPLFHNVMIETINRCNGTCSFCPANRKDESRPFKKMSEKMFYDIIGQLKNIGWKGKLFMCVNNEPFIDNRILEFCKSAKKIIPDVEIALITNGTLLTPELMDNMAGIVNQITINDYSEKYILSPKHRQVYRHIKRNKQRFEKMKIMINRRYSKEILATRAGNAPNKPKKNIEINCACVYPFTDLVIFPDGQVGICCNDCSEISEFGDISKELLIDIWRNEKFRKLRMSMLEGQRKHPFCKECDVLDAGEREEYIKNMMRTGNISK